MVEESGQLGDDKTRYYLSNKVPLYDENGDIIGICGFGTEITHIKELENDLILSKESAEMANKAKSVFLANMSHELRTPLNAILGFAELLERHPDTSEDQRKRLKIINRSGHHLLELINDILEISKIEVGEVRLNLESFDFYQTLDNVSAMIKIRADHKGLEFTVNLDANVPRYIKSDEHRLRQILLNLLGNAVKFTETDHVSLQVSCKNSALYFEISDTGPGIDPLEQERLFESFYQTSLSQSLKEGTGLGLSISRKFIRLMNGDVSLQSEMGKGSTFRFYIKFEGPSAMTRDIIRKKRPVIGFVPGRTPIRILIAEDDKNSRLYLLEILQQHNFDIREANDGMECLDIYQSWHPNLILMDVRMPKLDGLTATRRIRTMAGGDEVKIIAVTASVFKENRQEVIEAGCNDFISKPVEEYELFEALSNNLGLELLYETGKGAGEEPFPQTLRNRQLTQEDLSVLPRDILKELKSAAINLDQEGIIHLSESVSELGYSEIAEVLVSMADDYRFNDIDELTEI